MKKNLFKEISELETEAIDSKFADIDLLATVDILTLLNEQDNSVPAAIKAEIPNIVLAVDAIVKSFKLGGRLFYFGAGTSGRLGILDAAECPPTFGTESSMVQGIIAGGKEAAFRAIEGAEDFSDDGKKQIIDLGVNENDVVCGLSASGRTPFVVGALNQAKLTGAVTVMISTNSKQKIIKMGINADVIICPQVGAEVIAGSTRLKSGTAQKLVLNMLTTTAMIKLGKTYKNIMIDLKPTNSKLKERAKRIIMTVANVDFETAEQILIETNYNIKIAILMLLCKVDAQSAEQILKNSNGFIRPTIG
jgi:N-acetylmuramic acid 6-phosphate etherase